MSITNYYKELNVSSDLKLEDINKELNQLESIWKRREISSPEKASKILKLIVDAKQVFRTTVSREEYDEILEKEEVKRDKKK